VAAAAVESFPVYLREVAGLEPVELVEDIGQRWNCDGFGAAGREDHILEPLEEKLHGA